MVVLDDQLPVRRQLVAMGGADDQALGLVRRHPFLDAGQERPERRSVAAGVDHHPPVPVLDGHRDQSVLRPVEPVGRVEPGRRQQRAVQPVAPPVVRAVDRPVRARRPARRQFVGAVLAGVVEAAQLAVVAAHQQHGVVTDLDGPSGTDRGEVVRPSRADPGAGEEVRPLPRQDGVVEVGGRRQHRPRAGSRRAPAPDRPGRSAPPTSRTRRRRPHPQRHRPTHRERATLNRCVHRRRRASASTRRVHSSAGMPVTPPPPCVADEHWYRPRIGVVKSA